MAREKVQKEDCLFCWQLAVPKATHKSTGTDVRKKVDIHKKHQGTNASTRIIDRKLFSWTGSTPFTHFEG
jgi:hypothetical protein